MYVRIRGWEAYPGKEQEFEDAYYHMQETVSNPRIVHPEEVIGKAAVS